MLVNPKVKSGLGSPITFWSASLITPSPFLALEFKVADPCSGCLVDFVGIGDCSSGAGGMANDVSFVTEKTLCLVTIEHSHRLSYCKHRDCPELRIPIDVAIYSLGIVVERDNLVAVVGKGQRGVPCEIIGDHRTCVDLQVNTDIACFADVGFTAC